MHIPYLSESMSVPRLSGFMTALVAIGGCFHDDDSAKAPAITTRDSAQLVVVDNDLERLNGRCDVSATPTIRIGVAEGSEEYELHGVFGATRLHDHRIVVVNKSSGELRFYGKDGNFIARSGRTGSGPGEFRNAFYVWTLPGDTMYVGDYRPWQFLVFGPDGKWIKTVRPSPEYSNPPRVMTVLADGRLILAARPVSAATTEFAIEELVIVVHRADGTLYDTIGVFPNGRWGRVSSEANQPRVSPLFESFVHLSGNGSRVAIGQGAKSELAIYEVGTETRLDRLVRWTAGDRSISSAEIDAERQRIAEPFKDLNASLRRQLLDPLISEKRPIARELPALSDVSLGRDGRIWFREYSRPTATKAQQWLGFDPDGRFLCRAAFPMLSQLLEIGADYALVQERDGEGVERVLQYSLGQPRGETRGSGKAH
jgi:hypothetical protein